MKSRKKAKHKILVVRGMTIVFMHGKKVVLEYHSTILRDEVRGVTAVSSQSHFGSFSRQSPKLT
jgi:hypothetical protein